MKLQLQLILVLVVVVGANTLLILDVAVVVTVHLKITDAYDLMLFFILGYIIDIRLHFHD